MDKRILIIEDEQNIVDIQAFNLQRDGYQTLEAMDGATGLELALERDPDLTTCPATAKRIAELFTQKSDTLN